MMLRFFFAPATLTLSLLAGCSSDPTNAATNVGPPPTETPACEEGTTRCDGDAIATCSGGVFGASAACPGEGFCRESVCREPTAKQREQATELAAMLGYIREETAWHSAIDWDALQSKGRKSILGGDGGDRAYFTALYRAFIAVPQGHQSLYLQKSCGKLVPYASQSQRGACGQPHSRGVVVTNVTAKNTFGLKKGDLITRIGDARGAAVLTALAERPSCTASTPSASSSNAIAATTFADLLEAGDEIEIEDPSGASRTLKVETQGLSGGLSGLSCSDPFSRPRVPVESELRPDGIGVIRLGGFTDPQQQFPTDGKEETIAAYKAAFEAKILAAFDAVKSAPGIVWDIRGNGGGLTMVGLGIASGFPGARPEAFSYCEARIQKTDPPTFDSTRYAEYALTPGGPFAYTGKVAIVTDGLDYSAADYFPLAAKTRTNATLVGAPAAGAFGATSKTQAFDGTLPFTLSVDINRCSSLDDGQPLEGKGVTPHISAEYSPQDLAAGIDTLLERAVAAVK